MNGAHDLGGVQGHGPVETEAGEPVFHAGWEKRVLAMSVAMGAAGKWNIDMSRFARENRPPLEYLRMSYYEIWLAGLQKLILDAGLASVSEMSNGLSERPSEPVARVLSAEQVAPVLLRGAPADRPAKTLPRFEIGSSVQTRLDNPATHTRLPRYARGRVGLITDWHGAHVFPDVHAVGGGDGAQHMYTVTFAAKDLWGPDTSATNVSLNCWESYLETAP